MTDIQDWDDIREGHARRFGERNDKNPGKTSQQFSQQVRSPENLACVISHCLISAGIPRLSGELPAQREFHRALLLVVWTPMRRIRRPSERAVPRRPDHPDSVCVRRR